MTTFRMTRAALLGVAVVFSGRGTLGVPAHNDRSGTSHRRNPASKGQ